MPGQSYHEFGLAVDMYVDDDKEGGPVYDILAVESISVGLTPGRNFKHPDSGHIQLGSTPTPYGYNIKQINDYFEKKNLYQ